MIFNLNIDRVITEKFHKSLDEYHVMMYQYIDKIVKRCNGKFNPKQINNQSIYYDQYGPRPFNYFDDDLKEKPQFEFY